MVILLCPLCPFFAIFCYIIETSDFSDLQLLEDVTRGLMIFENFNLSISNVRELLNTLVSLCKERLESFEDTDGTIMY